MARLGGPADGGPAGIAKPQEPADLVEGLACGVVDRRAEEAVGQVVPHLDQERVSARHDERDQREDRIRPIRGVAVLQPGRVHVALEVVDPDERHVVDPGERLREVDPDEQRPGESGAVGDGDRAHVRPIGSGIGPCLIEHRHDPAQVGPGGHLGNDPASGGVERHLRGDDVRTDHPAVLDQGDAGFVAGRFDRQDQWTAHESGARSAGGTGGGLSSIAARRRAIRSRIGGSRSWSVVMIRASSPLSL